MNKVITQKRGTIAPLEKGKGSILSALCLAVSDLVYCTAIVY